MSFYSYVSKIKEKKDFCIGRTNMPAPEEAIEAAKKELNKGIITYKPTKGSEDLLALIAEREKCEVENIVITPGSKYLITTLLYLLNEKKYYFDLPNWPGYEKSAKYFSIIYDKNSDLEIICNPRNPDCYVYSEKEIKEKIEKRKLCIIDEAYKGLSFKKINIYENAIRIRSFSKEFSMEGWRIAYAVCPEDIAKKIIAHNENTFLCIPSFIEKAAIACLENEKKILKKKTKIFKKRADFAYKSLRKKGFKAKKANSGIYIFTELPFDDLLFTNKLLEKGFAIAPGTFFKAKNYARICLNDNENELEKLFLAMQDISK